MNSHLTLSSLLGLMLLGTASPAQLQFREARSYTAPNHKQVIYNCRSADVTGDGLVDLIYVCDYQGLVLYVNDGRGGFVDETTKRLPPAVGYASYDVAARDMDGDGDLDLVVANDHVFQNRILINNGQGVFKDESAKRFPKNGHWTTGLAVFDADGDKDLDIFFYNYRQPCHLFLNNGSGTFSMAPAANVPLLVGTYKPTLASGDLDRDGDIDLLIEGSPLVVLENNGKGAFQLSKSIAFPTGVAASPRILDFDLDGRNDVFFAGQYRLFLATPKTGFKDVSATHLPGPGKPHANLIADVDLDGDLDLVGSSLLLLNDGTGRFTDVTTARLPGNHSLRAFSLIDDLDGDGDADLLEPQLRKVFVNFESQSLAPKPPARGSTFALEIYKKPGYGSVQHATVPLLGFKQANLQLKPFGILGIAPALLYALPAKLIPAKTGKTTFPIPIPLAQQWLGVDLYFQAATLSPSGRLRLGNLIRERIL